MRASVFYTLARTAMLLGATLFAETKALQQVRYICRRGSYDGRCYRVSRRHVRYVRPQANRGSEWNHPYNPYYWGSGVMTSD